MFKKEKKIQKNRISKRRALACLVLCGFLLTRFPLNTLADDGRYVEVTCGVVDSQVALPEAEIRSMCIEICEDSVVDSAILEALCYQESRFNPEASNGNHLGLCQISSVFYEERAEELGVEDLYDPYGNLSVCADILEELYGKYEETGLVLMCYNEGESSALSRYEEGIVSDYASDIMENARLVEESQMAEMELESVEKTNWNAICLRRFLGRIFSDWQA